MLKEIDSKRIQLDKHQPVFNYSEPFYHATDGSACDFLTHFSLRKDDNYLKIDFKCDNNFYTDDNIMNRHNEPLFNQEVFEVFIGTGSEDSKEYFEIEVNPNNALWIGKIVNPSLGQRMQQLQKQYTPEEAGIIHHVQVAGNSWGGSLNIPWHLIGKSNDNTYRINFYRIRSRFHHENPNWVCNPENCDFVCWQSTFSGRVPAFHRPKKFGFLEVQP